MENGTFMVLDSAGHPVSIDIPFSNSSIFGSYIIGTSGRKKTSVLSIESGAIVANSSHGTVKSIYDDAMVMRAEDGSYALFDFAGTPRSSSYKLLHALVWQEAGNTYCALEGGGELLLSRKQTGGFDFLTRRGLPVVH